MSEIYVVAYDDSAGAQRAVKFAANRATLANASLHLAYVLEWSPYNFLTAEELEERHKRRREEVERASQVVLAPKVEELTQQGLTVTSEVRYGNVARSLHEIALEKKAQVIYIAKASEGGLVSMMLGNVPGSLIQLSTVPVAVIP